MMSCIAMLVNHNLTVRSLIIETLEELDPDDFVRDLGAGIGSIRDILIHLIDTERYWLSVLEGTETKHIDSESLVTASSFRTTWCEIGQHTAGFLMQLNEEQLNHVKSVRNGENTNYFTVGKALIHLATHEIHHRGLIIGLIRQLGLEPPNTNMLWSCTQ
jgi:uncharacterized damage-inducible protein DinB